MRLFFYRVMGVDSSEQPVAFSLLPPLLLMALFGNLLEEVLFRGYFQGYLEKHVTPLRAALGSGVFFAVCHTFLATTVTALGAPILVFTLFEGTIAGLVRMRMGVLPAALAHGGAIFLLASGYLD